MKLKRDKAAGDPSAWGAPYQMDTPKTPRVGGQVVGRSLTLPAQPDKRVRL